VVGGFVLGAPVMAPAEPMDIDGLNVFISPHGQPFRAPKGAPYPIDLWFKQADTNGDGKIDHAEFVADAAAFFKILDQNHDGVLSQAEVAYYERRICPEILGLDYEVGALTPGRGRPAAHDGAQLWLAQFSSNPLENVPTRQVDPNVEPLGKPRTDKIDETKQGASPFSLFDEPEPVATADFDFNGKITRANFLRLADMHFSTLDHDGVGYLVLSKMPKTAAQIRIAHPNYR